jgi:hypothetical protein
MQDTTALEGLFEEVRCSVERLDYKVVGIEQRVNNLSTGVEREKHNFSSFKIIMDFKQFLLVMFMMIVATAVVVFYLMVRIGG